jgi:hypothetical protein
MKEIFNAMIFGFKEILTWNTMKYALISGLLVSLGWGVIGYFLWDILIVISSHIIDWVPFSMVRSNGAWMLSTFLWLQLVLLTFALIFVFFGNVVLRHISKDKYSLFSLWVAVGSAIFWGIVWFIKGDYIYHEFLQFLTVLPFQTVEKGIAFFIGFYFIYNAIVVTMVFVASLFSEPLIISVEKRHFAEDEVRRDHIWSSVAYTLKDSFIFLGASLLLFPLLFVPVLNIFVQIGLWTWLIKDTMTYDAASLVYEKVDQESLKKDRLPICFISIIVALFNLVPVLNIFGPFFGVITLFHYFKNKGKL